MVFNVKDSEERRTVDPKELPFEVIKLENVVIPMRDGAKLLAHIWIPKLVFEGKSPLKIGSLVEYLPYRKSDFTSVRDSIRHPYYAGYGFASLRVDMRGCGDSDGVILGEYLEQEQQDNLDVFTWITKQSWSNGNIGQFGKSWGGFNSLQIAAKKHPALKAVITLCSTDDRYADDVHYRGGCMLASDMLWWASTMFAYNCRPQDPHVRPDWRETWMKRLELEPNVIDWVKHQTRDDFWKHGSVCEDYLKVDVPVLAVGGWRDGYTNAIFRMMKNFPHKDNKSIIGPWVHEYPEVATPSPSIGYNQIAIQWFDKYLNTELVISNHIANIQVDDFHIDKLQKYNAYIQDPVSISESYISRPGKWISCDEVVDFEKFGLKDNAIVSAISEQSKTHSFSGLQHYGLQRGTWCPFGQSGDFPGEQKVEDTMSYNFDSEPLTKDSSAFGFPQVRFSISSDTEVANVSVRLVDIDPEKKEHILVTWGQLNLNKYIGTSEHPEKLVPGQSYDIELKLDAIGYVFQKGHKLRIAFSSTDWPSSWPLAVTPNLTLEESGFELKIPIVPGNAQVVAFPQAESLAPCDREILREDRRTRAVVHDVINQTYEIQDFSDEGQRKVGDIAFGSWNKNLWFIGNDPLSARNQCQWELTLAKDNWDIKLLTDSTMEATATDFILYNKLEAFEGKDKVFEKEWNDVIPRNFC